jgi:hypothetical protein
MVGASTWISAKVQFSKPKKVSGFDTDFFNKQTNKKTFYLYFSLKNNLYFSNLILTKLVKATNEKTIRIASKKSKSKLQPFPLQSVKLMKKNIFSNQKNFFIIFSAKTIYILLT